MTLTLSLLRLLQTLFPLLPMSSLSTLRSTIRRTILTLLKTENQRCKNHKLNRAVQAMLFGMVERGIDGEVLGDKGKPRGVKNIGTGGVSSSLDGKKTGDEAMWAVNLTTELWKRNVWYVWPFSARTGVFFISSKGTTRKQYQ